MGPHPNKWDERGAIIEVRQFDQYLVCVDGSGRITLCNRKFLRRYVPVQEPQPRGTIHDDFRQITKLPAKPAALPTLQPTTCMPTTLASNQPTPESPLAKAQQGQFPPLLPQHTPAPAIQNQQSPPPPEAAVEPQQTIVNPPPTPVSPSALTPPTPKRQPLSQDSIGIEETHGLQQERP